jgi:hypothetical protein
MPRTQIIVMAGLDPATQDNALKPRHWVAGSRFACPAMTIEFE